MISRKKLYGLVEVDSPEYFRQTYKGWIDEAIGNNDLSRDMKWYESIALGTKPFVEKFKDKLDVRAIGRNVAKNTNGYELKAPKNSYRPDFGGKMGILSPNNSHFGDDIYVKTEN